MKPRRQEYCERNDFLNAVDRPRLNYEWDVYVDVKKNTAFTYLKWRDEKNDTDLDDLIKKRIMNEISSKNLKNITDVVDNSDLLGTDIYEMMKLNKYLSEQLNYGYRNSTGENGTLNLEVYNKADGATNIMKISYDKVHEWSEEGYLQGDPIASEMTNLIMKNNNKPKN